MIFKSELFRWFTGLVLAIFLGGCAAGISQPKKTGGGISLAFPQLLEEVRTNIDFTSETLQLVDSGVTALAKADYSKANDNFNLALKLDPANSWLQFLNGLSYHLGALNGDGSLFDLSKQGYLLAIKFDSTNWIARYHLGLLSLDQKKYSTAQEQFAEALLFDDSNPDLLYSMVVASYYAHDPTTAAGVLARLSVQEPDSKRVLRAACMVRSALGDQVGAKASFERYNQLHSTNVASSDFESRIYDWQKFHEYFVQEEINEEQETLKIVPAVYKASAQTNEAPTQRHRHVTESPTDNNDSADQNMIIVDVVMVGTEENLTTRKGVNLLNGLSLQFGTDDDDGRYPGYSYSQKRDLAEGSDIYETSKTITRALSLPAINYSLNIFNSTTDRAEVLARPTLIALDGEESTFFSGLNIKASTVGNSDGGSVEIDERVGVTLAIKPTFLDDNSIKLNVHAQRRFLKTPSPDIVYENKIETTETDVSANVIINFGETLVLSGLSEKETERLRDGVPFLQDIPGLQYLFSQQDERDFQRSVLILLTPRPPQYIFRDGKSKGNGIKSGASQPSSLNELQARYSDWFKPYPNWASVFHQLQSNSLYREFRTGDVTMERWAGQQSLLDRLRQALDFLYY